MSATKMRQWYRIEAKAGEKSADILIFDDIGKSYWNDNTVTAKKMIDEINALPADTAIRVLISSRGGDPFEAIAIANALRDLRAKGRTVETVNTSLAASAASIVLMAGSPITINENALTLIHPPSTCACGTSTAFRSLADSLDKIRDQIVKTYQWNSNLSEEEIIAMMEAETWMDADEAIAKGFATNKIEGLKAVALFEPQALDSFKVPERFSARVREFVKPEPVADPVPVAASALEVITACEEAGCAELARELITAKVTATDLAARVGARKAEKATAAARVTAIRDRCKTANLSHLADGLIASAMTAEAVGVHLTAVTATIDQARIDANLSPDPKDTKKKPAGIDTKAVYEQLNNQQTKG